MLSHKNIEDVEKLIAEKGFWELRDEWRISTVTVLRIEKINDNGEIKYKALAKCDHEFICFCPTIPRAFEFIEIYEDLIQKLWLSNGWPSWSSKSIL